MERKYRMAIKTIPLLQKPFFPETALFRQTFDFTLIAVT
jgi:hypothetical protein